MTQKPFHISGLEARGNKRMVKLLHFLDNGHTTQELEMNGQCHNAYLASVTGSMLITAMIKPTVGIAPLYLAQWEPKEKAQAITAVC